MNALLAVTKKRRNIRRIARAFATVTDEAVRSKDLKKLAKSRQQQEHLVAEVKRIFKADCEPLK